MNFDNIYNVHCALTLESGREITLDTLVQRRTYGGLLAGQPNEDMNNHTLEWHRDYARQLRESFGETYLIPPRRRNFRVVPGDMQPVLDQQHHLPKELHHIPEWMPEVYCIGIFHSISPARDKTKDWSALTILWYQADFGLDHAAMESIRLIDWDGLATDLEW